MKISYNWLKEYLSIDLEPDVVAEILTDIGLEVEGVEHFETVKGGLQGVVIGKIESVTPHPNADRLQLTQVDVGHDEPLSIVCGAPNVAESQKVVVALVGSTIYPNEKGFKIKKSKIRGEVSEGMLCAEDELGLGESHDGIMVLEDDAKVGQTAAEYFSLESDTVFEIGLTPNRVDAASHYGVARDLTAFLKLSEEEVKLRKPDVSSFKIDNTSLNIPVTVIDGMACPRYSGLTIKNLKVQSSPSWLQNRLKAIGLKPINNVVDVTNYVMHEIGQPLHAFDADKIHGGEIVVRQLDKGSKFKTLDGEERKLSDEDLMICNLKEGMCIAGVFGGERSGVTESTTSIFLESAYFNPVDIRKTAKRHGLNTDASFRYERGADPNITIYALKRATILLQEVANGEVSSEIFDFYPNQIEDFLVELSYQKLDQIVGQHIDKNVVKKILINLDIEILNESKEGLRLNVPAYRVDVQREVDVIEEVLRIYGYNRIKIPDFMRSAMITNPSKQAHKIGNTIADYLSSNGFAEIFNNSLSNPSHYQNSENLVKILNPLSKETEVLRKSMIFGGLEAVAYNQNRKRKDLKFFEFGKTYEDKGNSKFKETNCLALWMTGNSKPESWQEKSIPTNFYQIKEFVENCLFRVGVKKWKGEEKQASEEGFLFSYSIMKGKRLLAEIGEIAPEVLKKFDVKEKVFFAQVNWSEVFDLIPTENIAYHPVGKFPSIRRDLALLLDSEVDFESIKRLAKESEKRLLKEVNLFDVYEGKNLAEQKKSYGVSFTFQDEKKTLTDKQIDHIMDTILNSLKKELGAELR